MTPPPGLKAGSEIRTLAALLARTAKATRLYPEGHEARRRLVSEAHASACELLGRAGAVEFTVEPSRLLVGELPVLEAHDRDDPIPGRLFEGGIRAITFLPSLNAEDLSRFLLCLYRAEHRSTEDDVATQLWIEGLPTIPHRTERLASPSAPATLPEDLRRDLTAGPETAWADPTRPEERESFCREAIESLRSRLTESEPDLFALTHEESVRLEAEIAALSHPAAHQDDEARLWRALLHDERDPLSSLSMVTRLANDLAMKLASGSLRGAAMLIEVLGELEARPENRPPELADAMRRTSSLELDPGTCSALLRQLDTPHSAALEELHELTAVLPPTAIPSLCEILGQLETADARYRLIDCLIPLASGHIELLTPFLRDERWYLVRNVALILGEIGNAEAIDSLRSAMRHEEPRVRKEVLKAVGQLGGYKARGILAHALKDKDAALRTWAARSLGTLGPDGAAPLREALEEKDFARREVEEQRAFYEAYAYAARREAVSYLASLLEPRGLFRGRVADPIRCAVLSALGWAGGPEAIEILEAAQRERSLEVRNAAESALARALGESGGEAKAA